MIDFKANLGFNKCNQLGDILIVASNLTGIYMDKLEVEISAENLEILGEKSKIIETFGPKSCRRLNFYVRKTNLKRAKIILTYSIVDEQFIENKNSSIKIQKFETKKKPEKPFYSTSFTYPTINMLLPLSLHLNSS